MTQAYPLQWPTGWPRAKSRSRAAFHSAGKDLTVHQSMERLWAELGRLGTKYVTLSTNVELRRDGLPYSGQKEPDDPGAAVYFQLEGKTMALACDRWNRVADNIAAIAKHIEAIRGMDRWGVGTTRQAFAGYEALPAPEQWWQVLGVTRGASSEDVDRAYRAKAREAHPDRGGSTAAMARINAARDQARQVSV